VIEDGVLKSWPDEVCKAIREFRQGHLLKRPPVLYTADLRYPIWDLTCSVAEDAPPNEHGEIAVELAEDQRPPLGIVTTQDCDIESTAQPWVAVAPVYENGPGSKLLDREYIHQLRPPAKAGDWVADLRLEVPLEKGTLVGREPIEAFPDEDGYAEFAALLARRRGRPALAIVFNRVLDQTMRSLKQEDRKRCRRVREHVYKLLLAIPEGKPSAPVEARLYVVTKAEPDEETREWFGEWWDRARVVAEADGLKLHPVAWIDARAADLRLVDDLIELANPMRR
jgi:hypothetical protein